MICKNQNRIEDIYHVSKKALGEGSYGVVQTCVHKDTNQERAVKIVPKDKIKDMKTFQQEISILQELDHPHVLKLYEYFEDQSNIYLVTEICRGGELFDAIVTAGSFSEEKSARFMKQILQSLSYCHNQGVAHRDLKPENCLFETKDSSDIKIIDFGFSQVTRNENTDMKARGLQKQKTMDRLHDRVGTVDYMAPEVLKGDYGLDCDVWSAGCILYVMLCGQYPFVGDDDNQTMKKIAKAKVKFDSNDWDQISEEAKDLVRKLICKAKKRLTAEQALEHEWFKMMLKDDEIKESKQLDS